MTNALAKQQESLPAATNKEADNIANAAGKESFDTLLKFAKGKYFANETEVPLNTEFVAHALGWIKAWLKFGDGEVLERRIYRVGAGEEPPERFDLADLDKSKWPKGPGGRPRDPWVLQSQVPFENPETGAVLIFTTSSVGGRQAVAELCGAYARRVKERSVCGQPIVSLSTTMMPTTLYGLVVRPHFKIERWDDGLPGSDEPPGTLSDALDDSIPF
jgi:hypothetical protein